MVEAGFDLGAAGGAAHADVVEAVAVDDVGMARIRQMSGQVSRGSAGEYQADERAGVGRLTYRVSGR